MAIAQMNWGRMRWPLDDPRMAEFADALEGIYARAEAHPGFIWRLPDADAAAQLAALGHGPLISATVSVWRGVADLRDYTYGPGHGDYLARRAAWFEPVEDPQLVLWDVPEDARPGFAEAFAELARQTALGEGPEALGWTRG